MTTQDNVPDFTIASHAAAGLASRFTESRHLTATATACRGSRSASVSVFAVPLEDVQVIVDERGLGEWDADHRCVVWDWITSETKMRLVMFDLSVEAVEIATDADARAEAQALADVLDRGAA